MDPCRTVPAPEMSGSARDLSRSSERNTGDVLPPTWQRRARGRPAPRDSWVGAWNRQRCSGHVGANPRSITALGDANSNGGAPKVCENDRQGREARNERIVSSAGLVASGTNVQLLSSGHARWTSLLTRDRGVEPGTGGGRLVERAPVLATPLARSPGGRASDDRKTVSAVRRRRTQRVLLRELAWLRSEGIT